MAEFTVRSVRQIVTKLKAEIEELKLQLATRDSEISMLKNVYQTGRKQNRSAKLKQARQMRQNGMTLSEIATSLGFKSHVTVSRMLNK